MIYLIDSGINLSHPEFRFSNITAKTPVSGLSHGTEVCSLICGYNLGVDNALTVNFYDVENLESSLSLILEDRLQNINEVGIVVCAWSLKVENETLKTTLLQILDANSILIAAVGNNGKGTSFSFPANIKDSRVITVGSHDPWFMISKFNSVNPPDSLPTLFAPGRKILVATGENEYDYRDGTSFSCATVAGSITYYLENDNFSTIENFLKNREKNTLCWKHDEYKNYPVLSLAQNQRKVQRQPKILQLDNLGIFSSNNYQLSYIDTPITHNTFSSKISSVIRSVDHNPFIPLSGGLDSEWIAFEFVRNGLPFQPVIMRYKLDGEFKNTNDFQYAEEFCKTHGIKPIYKDLDLHHFFESEKFKDYAYTYYTNSPQFCCYLWLLDQLDGFVIMPGDPIKKKIGNDYVLPDIKSFAFDYYFYKNRSPGIARLHLYDFETMILGFDLYQKAYEQIVKESLGSLLNEQFLYLVKERFYQLNGMSFTPRDKKRTGFEEVKDYYTKKYGSYRYFDARFRNTLTGII